MPALTRESRQRCPKLASPVKLAGGERNADEGATFAASGETVKTKKPPTSPVSGCHESGREDLNLRPHGPEPCALAKLSYAPKIFLIVESRPDLSIATTFRRLDSQQQSCHVICKVPI